MEIRREIAYAPKSRRLTRDLAEIQGPCIGCDDCTGLCRDLMELFVLPDAIRSRR